MANSMQPFNQSSPEPDSKSSAASRNSTPDSSAASGNSTPDAAPTQDAAPAEQALDRRRIRHEARIQRTRKILSITTILGIIVFLLLGLWAFHEGYLTDRGKLQALLERAGSWAPLLFILLQIVQCIIPIIPGGVTLVIGVVVFGPWMGFVYNYIGIFIGETGCFLLARRFGQPLVRALVSEQSFQKHIVRLSDNQKKINRFFWITMLLPGMPDDFICMLAGLSQMSFRWFLITLAWTKVPSMLSYTLFLNQGFEFLLKWLQ
ncbi:MAG: TVP38/TMEM64 family protein [Ndongobacter sp.]|nr:TVP38/TMEM64 family protein [Ndongobacter sp.]